MIDLDERMEMTSFARLTQSIAAQPVLEASVALFVDALADRIKATSNDQNVQKLARELKAAAPAIVSAITTKSLRTTTD